MADQVAPHVVDNLLVPSRVLEHLDQFLVETTVERELASGRTVDKLGVARMQHDERDRVGTEDLEILRRRQFETTKQGTLRHEIDPCLAHCGDDLRIRNRRIHLDVEAPEALDVELKRLFQSQRGGPGWSGIPPQAQKTNLAQQRTD